MIKTMTANQKMAELFQRNKSTISRHIRNVWNRIPVLPNLQSGSSSSLDGKGR